MPCGVPSSWQLPLPAWLSEFWAAAADKSYPEVTDRMVVAIELARRNVAEGTGGPFGAAIFGLDDHRLVAPGVNLVLASGSSIAHAEMVAIVFAQQRLGSFDLGAESMPTHELACSAEPCAMCLGAIPWSGVQSVLFGARDEDIRAIGFDEGHKPPNWIDALAQRGIQVQAAVEREASRAVLDAYAAGGGLIYNSRRDG